MAGIELLLPMEQPSGRRRLADVLRESLEDLQYRRCRVAVAYAKVGPLLRLEPTLEAWREEGKTVQAIIGIDSRGTSIQALKFALDHFTETYVVKGSGFLTFHPKLYLIEGPDAAVAIVGSHNLTVGGTETNFEAGVLLRLALPGDAELLARLAGGWEDVRNCARSHRLNGDLLERLSRAGLLLDELASNRKEATRERLALDTEDLFADIFGDFDAKPPSSIQKSAFVRAKRADARSVVPARAVPTEALIIEIVPHDNGEVFLSKLAVDQNPDFFGSPFTGETVPKRSGNRPYPQRVPDPVVAINIFDRRGLQIYRVRAFGLNTVYYSTKSEIRITFSQEWLDRVPKRSLMVMARAEPASGLDYVLDIYEPGSAQYRDLLARCDQTLPSGGAGRARRMGWM